MREAEAKAAAALQRLIVARETLEREEARAKERIAELDRRLEQFAADLERERTLAADAAAALERLDAEEGDAQGARHRRTPLRLSGVNERVENADAALAASEKSFAELTGALADLTARRNQLQAAMRDHGERAEKLHAELANIEAGLAATGSGAPDLPALTAALAAAQSRARAKPRACARAAEAAHSSRARERWTPRAAPLVVAERAVQRLETEAKTIGKLLAVESKNLWPPVMDALVVAKRLRKGAGRGARRRSRRAGRRFRTDALGRRGDRSGRSGCCRKAPRRLSRFVQATGRNWRGGWRRSAWSSAATARGSRTC